MKAKDLHNGHVLADYSPIIWVETEQDRVDVCSLASDDTYYIYRYYASDEVPTIDFTPLPFFAALKAWCIASVNEIFNATGDELDITTFSIDNQWMTIGDWWCLTYQNWEGGIDCTAYDLSAETLSHDYGFEIEDQQKVIQVVEEQHCPRCPLYGRQPQLILPIEFEAQIAVGEMPICETCAQEERQAAEAK